MQLAKSAECGMFISETKVQQMPAATCVQLHPGDVIRTMDLRKRYGAKNPSRVVKRLVSEGRLRPIERGLYAVPQPSKFGDVPPQDDTLIRKFLNTSDFIFNCRQMISFTSSRVSHAARVQPKTPRRC